MIREDVESVLVKEKASATYDLLIQKAVKEGRVGGKYQCSVCGMRYHKQREARECCANVPNKR